MQYSGQYLEEQKRITVISAYGFWKFPITTLVLWKLKHRFSVPLCSAPPPSPHPLINYLHIQTKFIYWLNWQSPCLTCTSHQVEVPPECPGPASILVRVYCRPAPDCPTRFSARVFIAKMIHWLLLLIVAVCCSICCSRRWD